MKVIREIEWHQIRAGQTVRITGTDFLSGAKHSEIFEGKVTSISPKGEVIMGTVHVGSVPSDMSTVIEVLDDGLPEVPEGYAIIRKPYHLSEDPAVLRGHAAVATPASRPLLEAYAEALERESADE